MNGTTWVMAANAAFWIILGLYIFKTAHTQKNLQKKVEQWESNDD